MAQFLGRTITVGRLPLATLVLAAWLCVVGCPPPRAHGEKPNVVVIYGDDVGYADIGTNGGRKVVTPNIDALALQSLNFTDAHCTAATCTPSRFSLLTGVYAFRRGVGIAPPNAPLLLRVDEMTLPRMFKNAGYRTGIVGKWHLGLGEKGVGPNWNDELKPGPLEVGFESSFILPTTNDRVPCVYVDGHRVVGLDPSDPIVVGRVHSDVANSPSTQYPNAKQGKPSEFYDSVVNGIGRIGYMAGGQAALWNDEQMGDLFSAKATEFIAQDDDRPFFLFYSAHEIHIPNKPHPRFNGSTQLGPRGDAMTQLDSIVGEILAALDQQGVKENTILIFTSDNGPSHHDDSYPSTDRISRISPRAGTGHDASGKWRGGKYEIYEGGTRVPFMIQWPGRIEPGESAAMVSQIDFIATFAALLGQKLEEHHAPDSRNALATYLGQEKRGVPYLVEEARGLALRVGEWKYIPGLKAGQIRAAKQPSGALYHLADDPGESENVLAKHPDLAIEMAELLKQLVSSQGVRRHAASFQLKEWFSDQTAAP